MLLKSDINIIKTITIGLSIGFFFSSPIHAEAIDCAVPGHSLQKVCSASFSKQRDHLDNLYLTSLLVTDAPSRIIKDTQLMWGCASDA